MKLKFFCILLLYFAAFVSYDDALNVLALYGAIPLAFMLSFLGNNSFKKNKYVKLLSLLFLWVAFTYLGATYMAEANNQMKNILGVFVYSVTLANLSKDKRCLPWLYVIYLIIFIQAIVYAQNHILIEGFDISMDRLNDQKLNANTVAYYTFFVTFALFELGNKYLVTNEILIKVFRILFLAMYYISFMVAIYTASRQVLVIQLPLLVLLTYMRYINRASVTRKVMFFFVAIAVCIASSSMIEETYDNSFLKVRAEKELKDDSRNFLIQDAIKVGAEHPLMGVGPGNYVRYSYNAHFSHCTYTELFANTGILGFLIYAYILGVFVYTQYKRYRNYKDKTYMVFLICGLIYVFDNFFYVFYVDLWLMGFFILLASHSEQYYKYQMRLVCDY